MAWYKFWEKRNKQAQSEQLYSDSLIFGNQWRVQQSSRSLSAVFACINLISNAMSCLQFRVMTEDACGHRDIVKHDPLNRIFHNKNIQTMSMKQIIKNVMEDVLIKGQGFIYINRGVSGIITSLRYIPCGQMNVFYNQTQDTIYYSSVLLGNKKIDARNVIHIKDITRDGVNGVSILSYAKSVLDLARSAEDASQEFFDSGCNISGILTTNQMINDRQRSELKNSWNSGQGKKSLQVLPFGVQYHAIGTDASKSQLLESRQYEVVEICRYFGVSPHLIGDLSKTNYNTLEQENMQFLQYTLMPFITEFEQEFTRKVFAEDDEKIVDVDENSYLMRADRKTTAEYYSKMTTAGILSINDARRELGYSDVEDGDSHTVAYSDVSKANLANVDDEETDKNEEVEEVGETGETT